MTDSARELACKIVKILANAEAKAHGVPLEQVHFHEVGAVDSIVDIVAAAVCADSLELDEVYIPQLNEGRGMVRCQHGLLPIPVPAVANIISANQLKMHITDVEGELVTPTRSCNRSSFAYAGSASRKIYNTESRNGCWKKRVCMCGCAAGNDD